MTEEIIKGQVSFFDQDTWSGKMCRGLFPAQEPEEEEKISRLSSQRSQKSQCRDAPIFLYLRGGAGQSQDASWEEEKTDALFPSPGDYTMHSFGEKPCMLTEECSFPALPSGVSESHLSQILEEFPLPKYSLSAKACRGILNRAEKRGKKLPEQLEAALRAQANA